MSTIDPDYVKSILRSMPAGLSREQFRSRCKPDLNAGYRLEAEAAERAYFSTFKRKKDVDAEWRENGNGT